MTALTMHLFGPRPTPFISKRVKPQIWLDGNIKVDNNREEQKQRCARRGVKLQEQTEGKRTTPKEESTYLGKSLPTIDLFLRENEKSMMGRMKGVLERRSGRVKVFIGVEGGWHVYSWSRRRETNFDRD